MASPDNKERLFYHECWRKVLRTGETLSFTFSDIGSRERARMALYNSVKAVKNGTVEADPMLRKAVKEVVIKVLPKAGMVFPLIMELAGTGAEIQSLAAQAGIDIATLRDPLEAALEAEGAGLLGMLQAEGLSPESGGTS